MKDEYDISGMIEEYLELTDELFISFEKYDKTEHYDISKKIYNLYENIIDLDQIAKKRRIVIDIPNKLIRRFISRTLSLPFMCVYVFLYPRSNSLLYYELESYLFEELNEDYNGDIIKLCAFKIYELNKSDNFSLKYLKEGDSIYNACYDKSSEIYDIIMYEDLLANELVDYKLTLSLLSDTIEEFKSSNQNILDYVEVSNIITTYYEYAYENNDIKLETRKEMVDNLGLNILKRFDRELKNSIYNNEVISDLDGIMDDVLFNIEHDIKKFNEDIPRYEIQASVADAFIYLTNSVFSLDTEECIINKIMFLYETEEDKITFIDAVAEVYSTITDINYNSPIYKMNDFVETFNITLYLQRCFNKTFEEII